MWYLLPLLVTVVVSGIEVYYYDTATETCGLTDKSNYFYSYVDDFCYDHLVVLGSVDCITQLACLSRGLEYKAYQTCLADYTANATLAVSGSFRVSLNGTQILQQNYNATGCHNDLTTTQLQDDCDLDLCAGDLQRVQYFPQAYEPMDPSDIGSDDDDDSADVNAPAIALGGFSLILLGLLAACAIICLLCCCCICCLLIVLAVLVVVVAVVVGVYFFIRYRIVTAESEASETSLEMDDLADLDPALTDHKDLETIE